ncbi:MAG: hypothetical protein DMD44_10855 [Gemmatimonadetes bacterium]|nr:MAG: hypothetical protein DMD44_10855 [Gemmatimonadota bacterium]
MRGKTSFARRNVDERCASKLRRCSTRCHPELRLRWNPSASPACTNVGAPLCDGCRAHHESKGGSMNRKVQAAALAAATAVALVAGRVVSAQEPGRPMESGAQEMQGDHLTEAVKQTQAAIDAGNSGQKDLVVEHAREALSHAEAAEKERPSPKLEAAIRNLKQAVKQGKSGKVEVAKKAAQAALQKLQA